MTDINPELKGAVEAIIFISERPINVAEIQNILEGLDLQTIKNIIEELKEDYDQRNSGIKIVEVAGGYQMVTSPYYSNFVKKFYKIKHSEKLTMPSLETLSIIAYKQPVTKIEIESIRGVNVDGVIKKLLEKSLIRIIGRKEVVGRPFVYGTTRNFLEYFGLNNIDELPDLEELAQALSEREAAEITPLEEEELTNSAIKENTSSEELSASENHTNDKSVEKTETVDIKKES